MSVAFPPVTGHCPICGGSLFLASGGYVTCSWQECSNPTAVADILLDAEREHIVELDEHTFSLRHPLRERVLDELFDCGLHRHVANFSGPPRVPGRYRVIECRGHTWDHAAWERLS